MVKQEALKGQICRLTCDLEGSEKQAQEMKTSFTQQAVAQEAEFQQVVANLKKQNGETMRKLAEEREHVRISVERRLQQTVQQLGREKDGEIQQLQERAETLQQLIEKTCQQHEEVLLRA